MENPNYIDKATDKKYVLEPNEKIVHKAIAFITDYLNIKYDTGRKRRKEILKDVYATVKEENTGLRYFRRFWKKIFSDNYIWSAFGHSGFFYIFI